MDYYGWQEWEKGGHGNGRSRGNGRSPGCGWLGGLLVLSFFLQGLWFVLQGLWFVMQGLWFVLENYWWFVVWLCGGH